MNHSGRSYLNQKITIRVLLRSSPFINRDSASSTFLHGLSGRNMLNSFDMLNHASTTQKIVCSVELSLFSCLLALVYQLIVRSNCAFVLSMLIILVVRQAILFGMTRRNKLQYLFHIQDWVKEVVLRRSNC